MEVRKILISFKSGVITPIESDTLLSYIFALDFPNTETIFQKFLKPQTVPFIFSNAMLAGELPRPLYFFDKKRETCLEEALAVELERKKIKSANTIAMKKSDFLSLFEHGDFNSFESASPQVSIAEFKNTLKRFGTWVATPYIIPSVRYVAWDLVVYVKIYDKNIFELFFSQMQKILLQYGFGAWKARWYGKIKSCTLTELTTEEEEVFDYIHYLRTQGKFYLLNNYKPTQEELLQINEKTSIYQIHTKQAKMLGHQVFKWPLNFFAPWSVLQMKKLSDINKIYGDYYQSHQAFNFWYLF